MQYDNSAAEMWELKIYTMCTVLRFLFSCTPWVLQVSMLSVSQSTQWFSKICLVNAKRERLLGWNEDWQQDVLAITYSFRFLLPQCCVWLSSFRAAWTQLDIFFYIVFILMQSDDNAAATEGEETADAVIFFSLLIVFIAVGVCVSALTRRLYWQLWTCEKKKLFGGIWND